MMLAYNLFLLFKMDFLNGTEYRQQIKTFRLKYIFLAGKIIRTARSVVMKLSKNILIKRYMQKAFLEKSAFSCLKPLFRFKPTRKNHFQMPEFAKVDHQKIMTDGGNHAKH
jgi:hypothetical protein